MTWARGPLGRIGLPRYCMTSITPKEIYQKGLLESRKWKCSLNIGNNRELSEQFPPSPKKTSKRPPEEKIDDIIRSLYWFNDINNISFKFEANRRNQEIICTCICTFCCLFRSVYWRQQPFSSIWFKFGWHRIHAIAAGVHWPLDNFDKAGSLEGKRKVIGWCQGWSDDAVVKPELVCDQTRKNEYLLPTDTEISFKSVGSTVIHLTRITQKKVNLNFKQKVSIAFLTLHFGSCKKWMARNPRISWNEFGKVHSQ
jgi:hypothetical protein